MSPTVADGQGTKEFGTPKKRTLRTEIHVVVHEDSPSRTPAVRKVIAIKPQSPCTDLPKENQEEAGSVGYSSDSREAPRARGQHRFSSIPRSATSYHFGDVVSTPPHRTFLLGALRGSSSI